MKKLSFCLIIILPLLCFIKCDIDKGLAPLQNGIQGTITFVGEWPENTEQVLVLASTDFPPQGITQLDMGEPLPIGEDSSQYSIFLPPGTYRAVGVVWKEKNYEWNVNNIIGLYFEGGASLSPGVVEVPKDSLVTDINIVADFKRARSHFESSIGGTLTFEGQWPEGADNLFVVASLTPLIPLPTLMDLYISSSLPVGLDSVDYEISLPPDTYIFLAVILLEKNKPIDASAINGLLMGPFIVPDNTSKIEDIDIPVEFD
jgi:hypothetical protein